MDRFEFTPDLETGNRDIDAHVRTLLASANEILFSKALDESPQRFQRAMRFFVAYLDYHFASEDCVMADKNYPHRNLHSAFHAHVLHEATAIEERAHKKWGIAEVREPLYFMVEDWLIHHVKVADRRLADFLRGAPPTEAIARLPGIRDLEASGSLSPEFDEPMLESMAELGHIERLPWILPANDTHSSAEHAAGVRRARPTGVVESSAP
jgi:hemerythrin-like metal-binding protein